MIFVLLLFSCLIFSVYGCGLGNTITSITISRDGSFKVSCSVTPYPICPNQCGWTSETCEDLAGKYHWNKEQLMMTNITSREPSKENARIGQDNSGSHSSSTPNDKSALSISSASHSGQSISSGHQSIRRKCCRGTKMMASKCQNLDWKPNLAAKAEDKFNVGEFSAKCSSKNAVVQDVKVLGQNHFVVVVCCLNYSANFSGQVLCTRPGKPGEGVEAAAAIALGVSLPLALGIGIPQLLNCENFYTRMPDSLIGCNNDIFVINNVRTPEECCAICRKNNYKVCGHVVYNDYTLFNCEVCAVTGNVTFLGFGLVATAFERK